MNHQLYMHSATRKHFIERHDFYIAQVKKRVLSHFADADIEGEAEQFLECEYDRLPSDIDPSEGADIASDHAQNFYALLDDLKQQMILGALAGCFHQWDKDLRDFLERELMHTVEPEDAKKYAWDQNCEKALKEFGWDCKTCTFFPLIYACRLIVNVYKHGKGRSFDELAAFYPAYLGNNLPVDFLDHEGRLKISITQFDWITSAFRQFWESFPERLFCPPTPLIQNRFSCA